MAATIALGILLFTLIDLSLVVVLMIARRSLVPSGAARIAINGDPALSLDAQLGVTLLAALSAEGVFVPSACGGKGTCGTCKVTVLDGGGELLATEASCLTRRQAHAGVRLACQVKVRDDVALELPEAILGSREWVCRVRSNRNVSTFIKELVLELPEGEEVLFRAGGFVQLTAPPHERRYAEFDIDPPFDADWEEAGLRSLVSGCSEPTSRAYSMANSPDEAGIIMLNVRVATPPRGVAGAPPGVVSSWIFGLRPGDAVSISGPHGEFFARDSDRDMVFIGGGAGMGPMRSHILDQLRRLKTTREISFWYGARSLREAFYVELFDSLEAEHPNFQWTLALSEPLEEDAWTGRTGFIHQIVFRDFLASHPDPADIEYYLCGPPLMLAACRTMLDELGVAPEDVFFDEF